MKTPLNLILWLHVLIAVKCQFLDHIFGDDRDCVEPHHYKCVNGRCISRMAVCDGFNDCFDNTDETSCDDNKVDLLKCAEEDKFMCNDRKMCVPMQYLCNGVDDCEDQSDEADCARAEPLVPDNSTCRGFPCVNGACISNYWVCDGQVDCNDHGDESDQSCISRKKDFNSTSHTSTVRLCPETNRQDLDMFYCRDRSFCIQADALCDGLRDCRDGSDEGTFCANWTTMCQNTRCEESCKPTPIGPRCVCGKTTVEVNTSCARTDYCGSLPALCSQACINGNRTYMCDCDHGYRTEGNMCFAEDNEPVLYYSTENEIRNYNIKTKQNTVIIAAHKPRSVFSDGISIFWVEKSLGNHNVMRASLKNPANTKEVLLGIGLDEPEDIALDWLGRNIYLTESRHGYIAACALAGMVCTRFRDQTGIQHPKFIALNPEAGQMFWADYIQVPRIQRARMDGTGIMTLTVNRIYPPSGLTLDIPSKKLYWAETDVGISVINFDGSGKYEFLGQFIYAPSSLAVFENELYWDDRVSKVMQSSSKLEGDARRTVLFPAKELITSISIYHPLLQRPTMHSCDHTMCSDICIATGYISYTCHCPEDAILGRDKNQCFRTFRQDYLLVAGHNIITKVYYATLTKPERESSTLDVGRIHTLAYNPVDRVLFIFDSYRVAVYTLQINKINDGVQEKLPIFGIHDIIDMDYDYITNNLYYLNVEPLQSKLEVYSIHNQRKASIYTFEEDEAPISFCLMPEYGMLMVSYYQRTQGVILVDRFSLDGNSRFNVYSTKFQGFPVTVRYSLLLEKVFISNPGSSVIDEIDPEGLKREHFRKIDTSVASMSIAYNILFWTDLHSLELFWTDIIDHNNNIGSMPLSKFPTHTQLHLVSVTASMNKSEHACATGLANCSHVCVQPRHVHGKLSNDMYTCLCPRGQVLKDGVCVKKVPCDVAKELRCYDSNSCYGREKRCDGVLDCLKGEDELDCPNTSKCAPGDFNCPDSNVCIAKHQLCDGNQDCPDNSDEENRYCPIRTCQADEFMCTNGLCLFNAWVCDGENDCPDGVDEAGCVNTTCGPDSFTCQDGQCIALSKRCNGNKDCLDWTDEDGCVEPDILPEVSKSCSDKEYVCSSNKSICIPLSAHCDGKPDCPGGMDEIGCVDVSCAPGFFQCKHWQQCVPEHVVCNNKTDCEDNSDESAEVCVSKNKQPTAATDSGRMEPVEDIPCEDGYRCGDMCLELRRVCDGLRDCTNGEDEGGLCHSACQPRRCHHICMPTPIGAHCQCHYGHVLDVATNTCKDVDECRRDVCSHRCINIIGSYLCSCYPGYGLRSDGHSCKSTSPNITFLYISDNVLKSARAHKGRGVTLYQHDSVTNIIDLDYDARLKMIYLTTGKNIIAISEHKKIFNITKVGTPTMLATDFITGNIYIIDGTPNAQHVRVCNVMKNKCAIQYSLPDDIEVHALTLDPINRKMFYCGLSQVTMSSVIFEANLAGGTAKIFQNTPDCTGLTVDYYKKLLFVAHRNGRIRKVNYFDRKSKTLVQNDMFLEESKGLQFFEDHVYTLDPTNDRLTRCLTNGRKICEPYIFRLNKAKAFVIMHDHVEMETAEEHCAHTLECDGEGCKHKPECYCYVNNNKDMCLDIVPSDFEEAFPEPKQDANVSVWGIIIGILIAAICCVGLYMWRFNPNRMKNMFQEATCSSGRERVFRRQQPDMSWDAVETSLLHEPNSPDIQIHAPEVHYSPKPGILNATFVNWLYSSINKKVRREKYEPSVSVHLKPTQESSVEPLAGPSTSKNCGSKNLDSPQAVSDTESEIDVQEIL